MGKSLAKEQSDQPTRRSPAKHFAKRGKAASQSIPDSARSVVSNKENMVGHHALYDENLLDSARMQWQFGDWKSLVSLDVNILENHPERAKLALVVASAWQQLNDHSLARRYVKLAKEWGCDKKLIAQLLVAGVHNTLGRAAVLSRDENRAVGHFRSSVIGVRGDVKLAFQARSVREMTELSQLSKGALPLQRQSSDSMLGHRIPAEALVPRVVVVAGIPRSGSTWLYNCVRFILETKYSSVYACWIGDFDETNPSSVHLVKAHDKDEALATRTKEIYTTRRDIREIAGSLVRLGWDEKQGNGLLDQLDWIVNTAHAYWTRHTCLEIEYSEIRRYPIALVEKIAHSLGIHLDVRQSMVIESRIRELVPGDTYNQVTQLHPKHVSEGSVSYEDLLGEDLARITSTFQHWLVRYGYLEH